jgi:hypothetical protein
LATGGNGAVSTLQSADELLVGHRSEQRIHFLRPRRKGWKEGGASDLTPAGDDGEGAPAGRRTVAVVQDETPPRGQPRKACLGRRLI